MSRWSPRGRPHFSGCAAAAAAFEGRALPLHRWVGGGAAGGERRRLEHGGEVEHGGAESGGAEASWSRRWSNPMPADGQGSAQCESHHSSEKVPIAQHPGDTTKSSGSRLVSRFRRSRTSPFFFAARNQAPWPGPDGGHTVGG